MNKKERMKIIGVSILLLILLIMLGNYIFGQYKAYRAQHINQTEQVNEVKNEEENSI